MLDNVYVYILGVCDKIPESRVRSANDRIESDGSQIRAPECRDKILDSGPETIRDPKLFETRNYSENTYI